MQKPDKLIFAILFFSIFATITGVGIVVPLLPVYARQLGANGVYIGLIFGAFSLSRSLFLPFFGHLSDRKGRKPLIVPGLLAYTVVSVAFLGHIALPDQPLSGLYRHGCSVIHRLFAKRSHAATGQA